MDNLMYILTSDERTFFSSHKSHVYQARCSLIIVVLFFRLFRSFPIRELDPLLRKRRVSVLEQHLKVGLVPGTGLGAGLEGVGEAAEGVVARGRRVARAVRLAARLAPDEGVGELEARVRRRPHAEPGAVDVAPVAPGVAEADDAVSLNSHVCQLLAERRSGGRKRIKTGTYRPVSTMAWLGMPAVARAAPNRVTYFSSFCALLYWASEVPENSPGSASLRWKSHQHMYSTNKGHRPTTGRVEGREREREGGTRRIVKAYQEFQPATLVEKPRTWLGDPALV